MEYLPTFIIDLSYTFKGEKTSVPFSASANRSTSRMTQQQRFHWSFCWVQVFIFQGIWGFPKIVVPQNGWFKMETPIKMGDSGVSPFSETPIWNMVSTVSQFKPSEPSTPNYLVPPHPQ